MTTLQLTLVCLTAIVLAAIAAATIAYRARLSTAAGEADAAPSRVGHRVTIHTKQPDDQTLFGVLVGDYTDRITLEDAEYVSRDGATALPGRQDIATRDIAWIDVHALVTTTVPAGFAVAEKQP